MAFEEGGSFEVWGKVGGGGVNFLVGLGCTWVWFMERHPYGSGDF